jgi:hypothetical protein
MCRIFCLYYIHEEYTDEYLDLREKMYQKEGENCVMKGFIKGDQIKADEKIGAYNTHGVDEKLMKKILVGNPILMRQLWLQWCVLGG